MISSSPRFALKTSRSVPLLLAVAMAAFVLLTACGGSDAPVEVTLAGYERTPEPTVGSISLPPANRDVDEFAFQADPGELLMVVFGYTSCPDVCPTTLADARLAFNQLGARANDVTLAWVSIDPARDTAEVTRDYVETFVADGVALRTDDPDQLAIAADAFDVTYFVGESIDGAEPEVSHTPSTYVVDDTGSIILTWPFGVPAADMASDLTILLDRQQQP